MLQYIKSAVTTQPGQIPLCVPEELKDQLFRYVLGYTEAVAKETQTCAGMFWPFGNYLFCSEEGAVCVDNADAAVRLLHLMLAVGNSETCFEDHLKYGGCVQRLSYQFLMRKGFLQGDVPRSSYEAGLKLTLESSGLAYQVQYLNI